MYLTGPEILRQIELGKIEIDPLDITKAGPNSFDMHLGDELRCYKRTGRPFIMDPDTTFAWGHDAIDSRNPPDTYVVPQIDSPQGGWLIVPGRLYLGATLERIYCEGFMPIISGRSSCGRLGVRVHQTAGVGDDGFNGTWTMEIDSVEPVILYPGGRYFQCLFAELKGERLPYGDNGRYQNQSDPTPTRIHIDADKVHNDV